MIKCITITFLGIQFFTSATAQLVAKTYVKNELTIGSLTGNKLQIDSFKKQTELKIGGNLNIIRYNAYFHGANFPTVIVASVVSASLAPIRQLTDKCVPGTVVTFENIITLNCKGDTLYVSGKSFTFYNEAGSKDSAYLYSEDNRRFKELMKKEFVSGVIYFSGAYFPNVIIVGKNDFPSLQKYFSRCAPGSIITFDNCIYSNPDGTLSKPFTKTIKLD